MNRDKVDALEEAEIAISDLLQSDSPGEYNQGIIDAVKVITRLIERESSAGPAEASQPAAHLS